LQACCNSTNIWKQAIASSKITPYYSIHLFGITFTECLQTPINCKEEEQEQAEVPTAQETGPVRRLSSFVAAV
jgi:hypothetical protein